MELPRRSERCGVGVAGTLYCHRVVATSVLRTKELACKGSLAQPDGRVIGQGVERDFGLLCPHLSLLLYSLSTFEGVAKRYLISVFQINANWQAPGEPGDIHLLFFADALLQIERGRFTFYAGVCG
jgi:hypothetical protein